MISSAVGGQTVQLRQSVWLKVDHSQKDPDCLRIVFQSAAYGTLNNLTDSKHIDQRRLDPLLAM